MDVCKNEVSSRLRLWWVVGTFLVLLPTDGYAKNGYVIVDATVIPSASEQPTWIALGSRAGDLIHVPTGGAIVPVRPSTYYLAHIDFQKDKRHRKGTLKVAAPFEKSYEVKKDFITLIGLVKVNREREVRHRRYEMRIDPASKALLSRACEQMPEVFQRYPVRMQPADGGARVFKFECPL